MACRFAAGVSPVRTSARTSTSRPSLMRSAVPDAGERFFEILMNIVAERFEWGNINYSCFIIELPGKPFPKQLIE